MSTTELKASLHDLIDESQDDGLLSIVRDLLIQRSQPQLSLSDLPVRVQESVQRGLSEKSGTPHKEAMARQRTKYRK